MKPSWDEEDELLVNGEFNEIQRLKAENKRMREALGNLHSRENAPPMCIGQGIQWHGAPKQFTDWIDGVVKAALSDNRQPEGSEQ
jgi:hypothetical protein